MSDLTKTPYEHITYAEAFRRNLHHGGVEERTDIDGVLRAYHEASQTYWDVEKDPTAQDVVDALRFALMAQKEPAEALRLVSAVLEFAPETDSDRGIQLLVEMITDGSLKVALVDA